MPLVRRVAVPPAIGSVYKSPSRSKTIVLPSGLTSTDIHDPFVVVKFTWRPTLSGKSGFLFFAASGCCASAQIAITTCHNDFVPTTPLNPGTFTLNPCSESGTLTLPVAQTTRVDCSNGGTTVTLAGNGASYLVVAQFPVDLLPNTLVQYHLS